MRILLSTIVWAAFAFLPVVAMDGPCGMRKHAGASYVVCRFSGDDDIRLFLNDSKNEPYKHFSLLKDALEEKGETLIFAMNAGMYHEDRSPVGLYIEAGEEIARLNTNDGPGNFHMKPNGVFLVWAEDDVSGARVMIGEAYRDRMAKETVAYATQSGPMLVIDGEVHPRFLPDSDSLKRRNGVGAREDGDIYFVLSDGPVRFYDFAIFFRDELNTPNALYLDGTISRIYVPGLDRNDPGPAMGPIVGVVAQRD